MPARPDFSSPSRRRRTLIFAAVSLAVAGLALSTVTTVTPAGAAGAQTVFVNEGFTGSAVAGYLKPSAPAGTNVACLTASANVSGSPIPGCSSTAIDSAGSGALRLTSAGNTLEGGIGSTQSVPISKGLDASFDSYQYGGSSADGIVFYLAATDPYNPQVPTAIGQAGGSLGYSASGGSAGLAHGYLGLGLDVFGNYLHPNFDGSGCSTAPGKLPSNVSVRGPGNGSVGYCVLPGYKASLGSTALHGSSRVDSDVPVEVVINPSTSSTTSAGTSKLTSITVAATSYAIVFKTIGASSQSVVTGTLPDLRGSAYTNLVDPSWYSPTTGLPYKLTYGWVASTGGSTDIHEVNSLTAQTVNGPVPVLSVASSVSTSTPQHGSSATYTVEPAVSSAGGSEGEDVQVTTTFPTGITPTTFSGSDYACTISGQVEKCIYAGTTAAGSSLPTLDLPFTASGNAGASAKSIASVVASIDATAVSTSSTVTISQVPTTTALSVSPASPAYGATQSLTATVSSPTATGTVLFRDTTTGAILCSSAIVSGGVATCSATAGPSGSHLVSAAYSGDGNFASSSDTESITVTKAELTLTVSASPNEIGYGSTSTLEVDGVGAGATGSLVFTDADGTTLCTTTLPSTGCATADTIAAGDHAVSVSYSGDGNYASATSAVPAPLTVTKVPAPVLAASVDQPTVTFGSVGTFDTTGIPAGATGSVSYTTAGGTVICRVDLPGTSCASAASLGAGDYAVASTYSGDANHVGATSPAIPFTVAKATATIGETVNGTSSASIAYGASAMLDVTGLPVGATGTVDFVTADGTVTCTAAVTELPCPTSRALKAGDHVVTARWSGDSDHTAATSGPVAVTVAKAAPLLSDTVEVDGTITKSTRYGTPATLRTSGIPVDATGTVEFIDQHGKLLCTVTLPDTSCAAPGDLAAGDYQVTAIYQGDDNHEPATTAVAADLTVAKASITALKATVNKKVVASVTHGSAATLTTTGIPSAATGTVTYESKGKVLCTATLPETSCTTSKALAGGTYHVRATYSGDANHETALAAPVDLTVTKQDTHFRASGSGSGTGSTSGRGGDSGRALTLTVQGLPAGATGTVTFRSGSTVLCTATLPDTSCTTTGLNPGKQVVVASYSGDASFAAAEVTFTVTVPANAATTVLAFTGSRLAIPVAIGAGGILLGLGVAFLAIARRRRGGSALEL